MTTMKNGLLRAAFAIALAAAPAAFAGQVLDQHQDNPGNRLANIDTQIGQAQTFTAGISGLLTEVDFNITSCCGGLSALTVGLYGVNGSGGPTGSALAQQNVNNTNGNITAVNFSTPYYVTAGTQYAFELTYFGNGYYQAAENYVIPDSYTRGDNLSWAYQYGSGYGSNSASDGYADLQFQEYVTTVAATPEPSTWAMLAGGVALMLARRARKTAV